MQGWMDSACVRPLLSPQAPPLKHPPSAARTVPQAAASQLQAPEREIGLQALRSSQQVVEDLSPHLHGGRYNSLLRQLSGRE